MPSWRRATGCPRRGGRSPGETKPVALGGHVGSSTWGRVDMCLRRQKGGGSGSGGSGGDGRQRSAQGRVVRVMPDGVVTCRVPSGCMTKIQPLARVFSRWCVRHRQHRLVQVVCPPWAMRDDVVVVGPAGPVAAVGPSATPVAGVDELPLGGGGLIAVGGRGR